MLFIVEKNKLTELVYFLVRTSRSEFIVSLNKYLEARSHKLSVGMRFRMRFEGEEVPERRYIVFLAQLRVPFGSV